MVKNPPANAEDIEMPVQSLGQKDPLEKEMATHSKFLPGKSRTEEPGRVRLWGRKVSDTSEMT